jgi:hypothetical protein
MVILLGIQVAQQEVSCPNCVKLLSNAHLFTNGTILSVNLLGFYTGLSLQARANMLHPLVNCEAAANRIMTYRRSDGRLVSCLLPDHSDE